jgi:hypothetical protein
MWRCLQPLAVCQRLMWQFMGDNDSDRHSIVNLVKEELVARVPAITVGSRRTLRTREAPAVQPG